MYAPPIAPDATVNDPATTPADMPQAELEMRPFGDEEIRHVVSAGAKLEPETTTTVPVGPEVGDKRTVGADRML
jgi:hypothetical protein